ncbi:MAG: DUF2783 domain-containing protein, partial [Pseudomonadota bacterium]
MAERLITAPNLQDADGFYEALLTAHDGLTEAESAALNARLILEVRRGDQPLSHGPAPARGRPRPAPRRIWAS